jgi:hypothetical protein|tara:strand:- start:437 stop:904 length:468 start_codon:yes stop_codon:yes gene_type:complete
MQENKIGFIVDDLSSSQLSYEVISSINSFDTSFDQDFVVFFENSSPMVIEPFFGVMNLQELWGFDGIAIATSVSSCLSLSNTQSPIKKFFYVWDLEWSRNRSSYDQGIQAFLKEDIDLIARSEDHAKAIKNYCNRDVVGVFDFNSGLESLMGIIK